jgi:hypothetical protein
MWMEKSPFFILRTPVLANPGNHYSAANDWEKCLRRLSWPDGPLACRADQPVRLHQDTGFPVCGRDRQAAPRLSQGQIDELIKRVSHLRAQYDERSDDKIKAEMHALTKKALQQPGALKKRRTDERTQFTLLVMPPCF